MISHESIFTFRDYRAYLTELITGPNARRGLQAEFAKAMGCQASYLSQVLKEKAELTEDHALRLAEHLGLPATEIEYFLLLVRLSRASTKELKTYLESQITQRADAALELKNRTGAEVVRDELQTLETYGRYFSSWIPRTLHIATSSPRLQTTTALASRFGLTTENVESVLNFLASAGFVQKHGQAWRFAGGSLHIPKNSVFNISYLSSHHHQVIRSIEKANESDLHFASTFTMDKKDFIKLKALMTEWVEQAQTRVHASGTEEIYGFCLDLFSVD